MMVFHLDDTRIVKIEYEGKYFTQEAVEEAFKVRFKVDITRTFGAYINVTGGIYHCHVFNNTVQAIKSIDHLTGVIL